MQTSIALSLYSNFVATFVVNFVEDKARNREPDKVRDKVCDKGKSRVDALTVASSCSSLRPSLHFVFSTLSSAHCPLHFVSHNPLPHVVSPASLHRAASLTRSKITPAT